MPRFGWEGQIGAGEETTWGTAATIARFEEDAEGETGVPEDEVLFRPGIHGARSRLLTQTAQGRKRVSYSLGFDLAYKGLAGLFFKHGMGAVATVVDEVGVRWTHTFTRADTPPAGLTLEHEIAPDFYKLLGGRVNEGILESDAEGPARLTVNGFAKDYQINASGAAFSPPSSTILTVFHQAALTIDAAAKQYRNFRLRFFNDIFPDDFRSGARTVFSLDPRDWIVEGSLLLTAEEAAQLAKIRDFTAVALKVVFTGPTLGTGNFKWDFDLPKVRYRPTRRRIGGPIDESLVELPFEAFKDTADALTVKLTNDSATP